MGTWATFLTRIGWLRSRGLTSTRFHEGITSVDRHLPPMVRSMRAWRRIGGTRPPAGEQEFFLLAQGLRQEIERTYGEKFRQLAAKLLPITFGSDDVAEMGALRLIRAADVQKLEDDLKKGLSPQEALKSFPIIPLEEGISAILSRKVDCVFVNGSGNNRIQAISN